MPRNLPQELIELIVEEIGNENDNLTRPAALGACSLTSWAFLSIARKALFTNVLLFHNTGDPGTTSQWDNKRLESFLHLLNYDPCRTYPGQPLLVSHIKSLSIHPSPSRARHKNRLEKNVPNQVNQDSTGTLISILQSLPNVEKLHIWFSGIFGQPIGEPLQHALLEFCSSKSITNMYFMAVGALPVAILTNCPNLTSLRLQHVQELTSSPSNVSSPSLPIPGQLGLTVPVLKSLSLIHSPKTIPVLSQNCTGPAAFPLQLSSLCRLEVSSDGLELPAWRFIESLPSLCYLTLSQIQTRRFANSFSATIDFGLLNSLETLKFDCMSMRYSGLDIGIGLLPLMAWRNFRRDASVIPSSIRTLILSMKWVNCDLGTEDIHLCPDSGWTAIDEALSGTRFPRLSIINIDLSFDYEWDTGTPEAVLAKSHLEVVQRNFKTLLPSISESAIPVEFTVSVLPYED